MPDVDVNEQAVTDTATFLYNNRDSIIESLVSLQSAVTTLLTQNGGLWMRQASPVMTTSFVEFQHNLTDAITNIGSFADSFKSTVDSLNQLDTGYAQPPSDASPSDSSSGGGTPRNVAMDPKVYEIASNPDGTP